MHKFISFTTFNQKHSQENKSEHLTPWNPLRRKSQGERLEKELAEVRSILSKNEAELKTLHKENSKSFVVAVMLMFFAFLIYGLYVMFTNPVER
ncbi:hypothetical protein C0J52_03642 [Blattella germanica]|nr:hypothetical protein C0J52_03642 [Blattella germanica]